MKSNFHKIPKILPFRKYSGNILASLTNLSGCTLVGKAAVRGSRPPAAELEPGRAAGGEHNDRGGGAVPLQGGLPVRPHQELAGQPHSYR